MRRFFSIPEHVVFLVNEVPLFYGYEKYPTLDCNVKNFGKILECADWCLKLRIEEITVSMFSCFVFKFPDDEVTKTMSAFRIVLLDWLDSEVFISKGIRFKVLDPLSELPHDIANLAKILQTVTMNNMKLTLNILIGHSGEIHLRNLEAQFESSECKCERDIFSKCVLPFTKEPQLIISNCICKRITDYLLWKTSSRCVLHFHKLWRSMKLYHFLGSLIYFQFHRTNRSKL